MNGQFWGGVLIITGLWLVLYSREVATLLSAVLP